MESIDAGTLEIVKVETVELVEDGDGEGEETVLDRVNDQMELQSLHVPLWSLAITRQYQMPFVKTGVYGILFL